MTALLKRIFATTPEAAELRGAKAQLRALRRSYRFGTYSGHPEDILVSMDNVERRIGELREALKNGK